MTLSLRNIAGAAILSFATALPATAQQTQQTPGMNMPMPGVITRPVIAPADGSMISAMDKMSKDMAAVPMTGDADRDFAGMMIPHHQGAIDMATYELATVRTRRC